jgi:hypothetical protein
MHQSFPQFRRMMGEGPGRWVAYSLIGALLLCGACTKKQGSPDAQLVSHGALLPSCGDPNPPQFPPASEGAEFRAIVLLTVAEDGSGEGHCYLRFESRGDWEGTAMADRADWRFDPAHAGQKRERLVVYRLSKTVNK